MEILSSVDLGSRSDNQSSTILCEQLGEGLRRDGAVIVRAENLATVYDAVEEAARSFFELPVPEKMSHYIGNSYCHRGYVPTTEKGGYADEGDERYYEAFDFGLELPANDTHVQMQTPLMGGNQWPDVPNLRPAVHQCFSVLHEHSTQLTAIIARYLGLKDSFFEPLMYKPISQLRMLHYTGKPMFARDQAPAMGAHTDYEFFSLIDACVPGLQVLSHEKGWVDVSPPRGSVVMIVGDMLETLSNGYFRSALHRVTDIHSERCSFPFFCGADFDAVIRPITHDIRGARTARYEALPVGQYLLDRLRRDFPYVRERYPEDSNSETPVDSSSVFERKRFQSLDRSADA